MRPRALPGGPRAALLAGVVGAFAGCSDTPTDDFDDPLVASVRIAPDSATVVVGDTVTFTLAVSDSFGVGAPGRLVLWLSTDAGVARLVWTDSSTTADGAATAALVAEAVGETRVVATVAGRADTGIVRVAPPVATVCPGATTVPEPLYWHLENRLPVASGRPGDSLVQTRVALKAGTAAVCGAEIAWQVTDGGGSASRTATRTDSAGEATITWTLGSELGVQTVTATPTARTGIAIPIAAWVVADSLIELSYLRSGAFCRVRLTDRDVRCVPVDADGYAWSPSGDHVAFTSDRSGNAELYVMQPDGSEQLQLTSTVEKEATPAWSPDGRWIAVGSDSGRIRLIAPDGSRDTTLSRAGAQDGEPSWAPDGTRLAVRARLWDATRQCWCAMQIEVLALDGSRTPLTATRTEELNNVGGPCWSPEGGEIAYEYTFYGGHSYDHFIRFVTPSGTVLDRGFGGGSQPGWMADGALLAVVRELDGWWPNSRPSGNVRVYVGTVSGSWGLFLLPAFSDARFPRWRPVPGAR